MPPIKLGVVGLSVDGWFKNAHVPSLKALGDTYTLTASATSRFESAEQVAKEYKIRTYSGPESAAQLARDGEVDMLVVAVKTPLHRKLAMEAINAGKPVFLEWPLGNGLEEAVELAETAKRAGVRTMIGLQARQDLAIRKAKEIIDAGGIGNVLSTNLIGYAGSWGARVPERDAYTLDASNGATIASIPFGHFVDSLVYLLGDLESLSAYKATLRKGTVIEGTGETVKPSAEDQLVVCGQLKESGALVAVHYKGGQAPRGSKGLVWEIEGDRGVIAFEADGVGHVQLISPKLYLNGEQVSLPEDKLGNIGRLYDAFARDEKAGYNGWDHAVRVHRIVDAVERSIAEGKRQSYL